MPVPGYKIPRGNSLSATWCTSQNAACAAQSRQAGTVSDTLGTISATVGIVSTTLGVLLPRLSRANIFLENSRSRLKSPDGWETSVIA